MADEGLDVDVFGDLLAEGTAIGRLARNEKSFRSAYDAFRSGDRKAFNTVLRRLRPALRCRLACEWVRIKECVFLCLRLCGLPKPGDQPPEPRALAEAIVRITADEKAVRQLSQAIEKGDRAAFQRLVKTHRLGPLCHFVCHWVCFVRYRLYCRWICDLTLEERPPLEPELVLAGDALRRLLESGEAFDAAVAASQAGDAPKLRAVIEDAGLLHDCWLICNWFCSWRCVLACFTLCRQFDFPKIDDEIAEGLAFAQAVGALAKRPEQLQRLSAAVGAGDAKAFAATVSELELERFCYQVCHWICSLRCRRFCMIVCPPPDTIPLFTRVGIYSIFPIDVEFQADGTTTAGALAFTRTIPFEGVMPAGDASNAYEYRFRIAKHPNVLPGDAQDVVGSMIPATVIGQLEFWAWDTAALAWVLRAEPYWVNNPGTTVTIPQQVGGPINVPVNKDVKAGGWIEVPRENDLSKGGIGKFVPGGGFMGTDRLIRLDTTQFTNESVDLRTPAPGLVAGSSLAGGVPPHSEMPTYKVFFEAREVGPGPQVAANDLETIAFSNTAYTYTRHAEWDGGDFTTRSVCSLDIAEMLGPIATGCDPLHDHVHALYTCYHPYVGSVVGWLQGPGIPTGLGIPPSPLPPAPFSFAPGIAAGEAASGSAGHDIDISSLKPCAYILWLSATVRLTQGDGLIPDATDWDLIAFCKGAQMD
jgi:hypothetical protein